jgi:hypothetical protein
VRIAATALVLSAPGDEQSQEPPPFGQASVCFRGSRLTGSLRETSGAFSDYSIVVAKGRVIMGATGSLD